MKLFSIFRQYIHELKSAQLQDNLIMFFLLLVVIASGADLMADMSQGADTGHVLQEAAVMVVALLGFCWMLVSLIRSHDEVKQLYTELNSIKDLPKPSSQQVIDGRRQLAEMIVIQFEEWKLSKSEQEIGYLLLKGFSLKEISTLRGTAEKTIRQQASSVYKKAGVAGRHVFSAWFIEDLL
jgi:DNA-binding CsgD family transcriptional regulator